MKNNRLKPWVRILLVLCGLALVAVFFVPLWYIDLDAPQYPEGLRLLIYPDQLAGNVDIINGLNHYIGMKTLHTEDFLEFTVLPYIIGFFAFFFVAAGVIARRKLLYVLFVMFVSFGVLAMYDFWRWEYNYGHHLNPDAAIIIPGMAYQPPLIGFKQLLNFGAYSMPDIGGWIFIGVGALLFFATVKVWRSAQAVKRKKTVPTVMAFIFLTAMLSCNTGPEPLNTGVDNCHFCKMTISDVRFGAEIVTKKGKIYKFDDTHCLINFMKKGDVRSGDIKNTYLTNYAGDHRLIEVNNALLLQAAELRSPMGGNVAAFDNRDSLQVIQKRFKGNTVSWNELLKP
ncbi:MAG: nitrous oxide reductase accessory protein NosL [Chitinophagaceae bacterium]|nr:nitrous oxide reductase accessory protein NosL [Chitinophagaceae bacterium]